MPDGGDRMTRTCPLRYNRLELRYGIVDRCHDDVLLTSPERVASFCQSLADAPQESIVWIGVNTQKQVVAVREVFRGTTDACTVSPADIFRCALLMAPTANGMFIMHNHPSGHPNPSEQDLQFFARLRALGETLCLPVIDCLIIGEQGAWSLEMDGPVKQPDGYERGLQATQDEQIRWEEGVSANAVAE
jgi:DNA repair protein RadC